MERHFADFKGALKAGDLGAAESVRTKIEQGMPAILELSTPTSTTWGVFLESFVIILREGFEAILVLGAVVAFLIKTGNRARLRDIWWGAGVGIGASVILAVLLGTILKHVPASQDTIEGVTMLIAVVVLFSVSYWLISKVEAAKWQKFIREKVNAALSHGGMLRARLRRVPRGVPRGRRDRAVLPGAVHARRRHRRAGGDRPALGQRDARGDLHALLPVRPPHSAASVLRGDQRAALLHGAGVRGHGHQGAAGGEHPRAHGDPRLPARRPHRALSDGRDAGGAGRAGRAPAVRALEPLQAVGGRRSGGW